MNSNHLLDENGRPPKSSKKRDHEEGKQVGGSRAAMKRAKKKKKQQKQEHETTIDISHEEQSNEKDVLPLEDDCKQSADQIETVKVTKKPSKKTKIDVSEGLNSMTEIDPSSSNNGSNTENLMVKEILSELNPIEILYPERLIAMQENEGLLSENEPNPLLLLQDISTSTRANALLASILAPSGISVQEFYDEYWEQKPLLISRSTNLAVPDEDQQQMDFGDADSLQEYRSRLNGFLSKQKIKELIKTYPMKYGKDLNVTNYTKTAHGDKRRITLDQLPDDVDSDEIEYITAESNDLWQNFDAGCTIRLLCPQKYNDEIHALLSNLEYEFGCMVGSNAYLTPGGAPNQGFAPHYDDIEAFILQLEGYKHWLVYPPMTKEETLPRQSSRDFTEDEMANIEPIIDVELGPGDMLYMPRGWVHQANTCRTDHHSLHLTVSAMQSWSWIDYLEILIPQALETASVKSVSLRSGLPRNFLDYMGTMHEDLDLKSGDLPEGLKQLAERLDDSEKEDDETDTRKQKIKILQNQFKTEAKKKIMRFCKEAISMVTWGCDEIGKRFLSDRLPPAYSVYELSLTSDNRAENGGKIWPNTMVRLAKPGIARLVVEDDKAVVYHNSDNSRVFHEVPLSPLEFEIDDAPAIEMLLTTTEPHWICVQDLLAGDIEDKMDICQSLYDEGILAIFQTEKPDTSVQTG